MIKTIILSCILFTGIMINSNFLSKGNEVKGNISIGNCHNTIVKGNGYNKDGTEIMHSDHPLAQANRNVIISMHPLDFEPELTLTDNAYISQSEQTFIPHVLPIVVGSKVHFLNEDEFFHNVQSYTSKSRFSIGRRAPGISYSETIKKKGVIELTCDIHSQMNAKILSFDTPYFCRVDENGSYLIKSLPDGKYRMEIYHPTCDKITEEVEIGGGEVLEINYHLSNKV